VLTLRGYITRSRIVITFYIFETVYGVLESRST